MNRQKSFQNDRPCLYLVATPIGNLEEMTYRAIRTLQEVDYIGAEDTRNTVKILNHYNIRTKLISHHEHNLGQSIPKLINLLLDGNNIALVSDAGYPAISDPGYELVKAAIDNEINVIPISGANACLDALVVSGIAPQPFLFYGFLDHQDKKKKKELQVAALENGTAIDHIPPSQLFKVASLLGLEKMNNTITIGNNFHSNKMGCKGMIKIADKFFEEDEINRIAMIAPNIILNIIRDYEVVEKKTVTLPDELIGLVKCNNPKCITNNEPMLSRFHVIDKEKGTIKCHYCERKINKEDIIIR